MEECIAINEAYANVLRSIRRSMNINLTKFAELSELELSMIKKIERGKVFIDDIIIESYLTSLNVQIPTFYTKVNEVVEIASSKSVTKIKGVVYKKELGFISICNYGEEIMLNKEVTGNSIFLYQFRNILNAWGSNNQNDLFLLYNWISDIGIDTVFMIVVKKCFLTTQDLSLLNKNILKMYQLYFIRYLNFTYDDIQLLNQNSQVNAIELDMIKKLRRLEINKQARCYKAFIYLYEIFIGK